MNPPGMLAPDSQQAPVMDDESQEGQDDGSYTVCIRVTPDGSMAVGVEKGGAEPTYKPAENLKDALTQAMTIIRADGKSEAADDAFNAGFSGMTQQQGA